MRATGGGLAMVVLKRELAKKSNCRFASGLLGSPPGLAVVSERWSTASTRLVAASCSAACSWCNDVVAPPLLTRRSCTLATGLSRSCSRGPWAGAETRSDTIKRLGLGRGLGLGPGLGLGCGSAWGWCYCWALGPGSSSSCSRRHMAAQSRVTSSSGMARVCSSTSSMYSPLTHFISRSTWLAISLTAMSLSAADSCRCSTSASRCLIRRATPAAPERLLLAWSGGESGLGLGLGLG